MKPRAEFIWTLAVTFTLLGAVLTMPRAGAEINRAFSRPKGPCDIYLSAGDPCVAAYSTTRALYASYTGPLYRVVRQSDGKSLDIGVVQPAASPILDGGGYADAAAQDSFCVNTYCWIAKIYDQSGKHNDLTQAPRGGFNGPAMGGLNNLPIADMAPATIMGHKVYGVFIEPVGMGLRDDDARGTAVDDQAEGMYWVVNGRHFNSGCCFDFGNGEIDSHDDGNGTMETSYYGDATGWFHGKGLGPWIMTDQENNLVGCVNPDGSRLCADLPSLDWQFVTAMAEGEPHSWISMGGDAQQGVLSVMFDGPRVNATYDPMRKQGAILLGNGGDNSNSAQGTFYEGAMTAAGTFPTNATDQRIQANIVAAGYRAVPLSLMPATAPTNSPRLQTFSPGSSHEIDMSFTNTTGTPATGVELSISAPSKRWTSVVSGTSETSKIFAGQVAPMQAVNAKFTITSGPEDFNGDLIAKARWTNEASGRTQIVTTAEKVRNVSPIKINEFRSRSDPLANATDSFIELYNAGSSSVDLSNWTLTEHPAQQAIFSTIKIPAGTRLAARGFYLFGLSNSGLAVHARAGDATIYVRNTAGISAGDTINIGSRVNAETRKVARVGTAASTNTTVWQPLPNGPVIAIPAGSTNVPVASVAGFVVGQKIALGHGATYPTVPGRLEQYEVATVTAVGKPGTQSYLAADARAGAMNIQVASVADISVGDKIRLDIDSVGHGIETVTVKRVGTQAILTSLSADASAGATMIQIGSSGGLKIGNKITVGTPANRQTVTITAIGAPASNGTTIKFRPALEHVHIRDEDVVKLGTGLDLAAPLKFNHAANLPFSDRGTGISFQPRTAFIHLGDEPVQALGTGLALTEPLSKDHMINAIVRDPSVRATGYRGMPPPNQWFGGPELTSTVPLFGRLITVNAGSLVLRNAAGLVIDSLNYGGLVDPWAAEGYQGASGPQASGCYVITSDSGDGGEQIASAAASNISFARYPDGRDTDSNCTDFVKSSKPSPGAPNEISPKVPARR